MSRRAAAITQADVARALRAIEQVKLNAYLEITPDGTIRIIKDNNLPSESRGRSNDYTFDETPIEL